ncbi:MAG: hypothetical protein COS85_11215 [Armatimonadetes bacterium CG07_land_8_20_14_0_80_59_28]|nr:MAG: hypothetical protein COS85_11215 [Armatimonadetes bacterium CG07_land_8_20_14_0_80_59_28]PIX41471.1 MAG: hypothetical protein COZ56_11995 [Armatimonadetes bacterium CG_4_8_14_3_um_filter_58_9]PIY45541.1 MAG: hypothetical protein COZ05_06570 [Armatimonadetes bacterium CG_4_10_14_3_um_filter_59_10]
MATEPDPYLDTAVYHCQQAGEKAIKAFLTFRDVRFDKTHDVEELIHRATAVAPAFASLASMGAALTPYATMFRYPPNSDEPDRREFEETLEVATRLHDFVLSMLPVETHPPSRLASSNEAQQGDS